MFDKHRIASHRYGGPDEQTMLILQRERYDKHRYGVRLMDSFYRQLRNTFISPMNLVFH